MSASKNRQSSKPKPPEQKLATKPEPIQPAAAPKSRMPAWLPWAGLIALAALVVWAKWPRDPERVPEKVQEKEKAWTSTVDGKAIMSSVERILNIGPRVAGTEGSKAAQRMIKAELAAAGVADIREQPFTAKTPKGEFAMTNLIGVLPGKRPEAIALAAHYDSKYFEGFKFLGANDSASAVAVLFELARKLKARENEVTYYFVFLDGEEPFNVDWGNQEDGTPDNTYGSRYLAKNMRDYSMKAFVLLDMVGDADWSLVRDPKSCSAQLISIFEEASRDVFGVNFLVQQTEVSDDHIPFKEAGVLAMDLIDFEYGPNGNREYWHTPKDTIDKLSVRSLERTGTLVLAALPKIEAIVIRLAAVESLPAKK